jgi:hypothetical protein
MRVDLDCIDRGFERWQELLDATLDVPKAASSGLEVLSE